MSIRFAAAASADIVARCHRPAPACRRPANDNIGFADGAGSATPDGPGAPSAASAVGGTSVSRC